MRSGKIIAALLTLGLALPATAALRAPVLLKSVLPATQSLGALGAAPTLTQSLKAPTLSVAPKLSLSLPQLSAGMIGSASVALPAAQTIRAAAVSPSMQAGVAPSARTAPVAHALHSLKGSLNTPEGNRAGRLREFFSGRNFAHDEEFAEEEAFAHVERHARKEEVRYAEAERELLDYARGGMREDLAREFAEQEFDLKEGETWRGEDILRLVVTEFAVHLDVALDPGTNDLNRFGISDTDLYAKAESLGLRPWGVQEALGRAYRYGLVYRLHDSALQRTLTGVPYHVRRMFDLAPEPVASEPVVEEVAVEVTAFAEQVAALILATAGLTDKDEIFEFAAQLALAAVAAGHVEESALPEDYLERAHSVGFETPKLDSAVLILLESAHATEYFAAAQRVAQAAASAGLVDGGELRDVLSYLN
jgi:hypothetical protein